MKYPALPMIVSEDETLDACAKMSIARFGDGELRLAIGRACSSQRGSDALRRELVAILGKPQPGLMVGIPTFEATPRQDVWAKYAGQPFAALYKLLGYGSSFITRPDNAPWIDRPDYWAKVRGLWLGKDITLVAGDEKSITRAMLAGANSVRSVTGARQHAYASIDWLEEEIGKPAGTVLLCLGATATVLAARLAAKGVHALDLGHIGMFMKHAGAYRMQKTDLVSESYSVQLRTKHAQKKWGADGATWAKEVVEFAATIGAGSVLDYGCGRGRLKLAVPTLKVQEYDPGIPGKDHLPKPADMVACTDVLEHIEPDRLEAVLAHIFALSRIGAFFVIATSPAREHLPDGRNAHLICEGEGYWRAALERAGWTNLVSETRKGVVVWARK